MFSYHFNGKLFFIKKSVKLARRFINGTKIEAYATITPKNKDSRPF